MRFLFEIKMKKLIVFLIVLIGIFSNAQENYSIMSYNIRLGSVDDGENHWNKRKEHLVDLINYYQPDFLGTQEGQSPQLNFIKENASGYDFIGKPRNNDENGEFTAIFYNKDKFEILEQTTFWLSETPDKISKGWDANYERIATYVLFKDKKSKKQIWVINTHFDHIGKDARRNSALMILSKVKELKSKKDVPVFITGDFNSVPTDEPIQILTKELKDTRTISKSKPYGSDYTFTGFKFPKDENLLLDYIFINENPKVEIQKHAVIDDFYGDGKYPSDHLPVLVNFKY